MAQAVLYAGTHHPLQRKIELNPNLHWSGGELLPKVMRCREKRGSGAEEIAHPCSAPPGKCVAAWPGQSLANACFLTIWEVHVMVRV